MFGSLAGWLNRLGESPNSVVNSKPSGNFSGRSVSKAGTGSFFQLPTCSSSTLESAD